MFLFSLTRLKLDASHVFAFLSFILLSLCLVFCLSSSAQGGKQSNKANPSGLPFWVFEPQKDLSVQRYWAGVGQARSLSAAQDKARAEIAKIVQSNIKSQDQYNTSVEQSTNQNQGKEQVAIQDFQSVLVLSDVDLSHISIRQTYQDVKTGDYYALAVLDKQAAIDLFESELNQFQSSLNEQVQRAQQAQSEEKLLVSLVNWMRAQHTMQMQDKRKRWVRVLGGERIQDSAVSSEMIGKQINEIRPQIKLAILPEGENVQRLVRIARSFASKYGLKTTLPNAAESDANAVLSLTLSWDDTSQRGNMISQGASFDLSLGSNEEEVSGCHASTRKTASRLSIVENDVIKAFEKQLESFLTSVFFNQDMKGCL